MKKTLFFTFASIFIVSSIFSGCASTDVKPEEPVVEVIEEQEPEVIQEEIPEEPEEEVQEPVDEEYMRSVNDVSVSLEEFNEDKAQILAIIAELDSIMQHRDYKNWVTYLDQESINYWSKPANLQKAASRLPVRGLRLASLEDYFTYIFISSRVGKRVDEIRYETTSSVKAVQVNDQSDTVYYNFQKQDGQWKLHLPALTD